ncbi:DNA-binding transcriptional regulator, LysR family [Actinacidiphila alni]|uniref:DNA-binding transcriptional regulator, LysR family n=1 Tax=Actinacidiphila alni TaxID=380248 RepID=A0A1I2FVL5_9ACTN|nr:LysR family transcriptional regulator [Actinacidiphila alni]SFF08481.1 DNA-binding transcriptional regulator, LysR family [Actinacidiphila alni]
MERHEIETFLALYEELHFGRTADRLGLSGGRVSQIVKTIERRIGAELFVRTSRRVEPTELGRGLYHDLHPHHLAILEAVARARRAARGDRRTLTLGYHGAYMGRIAHRAATLLADARPDLDLRLTEVRLGDFVEPLRTGQADALLAPLPVEEPDIAVGPVVRRTATYAALAAGDPLARRETLSLEDLADRRFPAPPGSVPAYLWDHHLPRTSPSGRPIPRTGSGFATYAEMLAMVAEGTVVTVGDSQLPDYYGRPDVVYRLLTDAPPLTHGLVHRRGTDGEDHRALARAVVEAAARLELEDSADMKDGVPA